eukprot:g27129.t1
MEGRSYEEIFGKLRLYSLGFQRRSNLIEIYKILNVTDRVVAELVVSCWSHVTTAPSAADVVFVRRTEQWRNVGIWLKLAVLPICFPCVKTHPKVNTLL